MKEKERALVTPLLSSLPMPSLGESNRKLGRQKGESEKGKKEKGDRRKGRKEGGRKKV